MDISPQMLRFMLWGNDHTNFEKTDFDQWDIIAGLQSLVASQTIPDEAFDLLMAIFHALAGNHPKFRLIVQTPNAGSSFSRVKVLEAAHVSYKLADDIDMAVANGEKQESAIQVAMAAYSLSRREVFRRLQAVRNERAAYKEYARSENSEWIYGAIPDGYRVGSNGRLVPIDHLG